MSIVSSNGILVNIDWMSKDAINSWGSWLAISLQKEKESLTVYSLIVYCFSKGTKNVARL